MSSKFTVGELQQIVVSIITIRRHLQVKPGKVPSCCNKSKMAELFSNKQPGLVWIECGKQVEKSPHAHYEKYRKICQVIGFYSLSKRMASWSL